MWEVVRKLAPELLPLLLGQATFTWPFAPPSLDAADPGGGEGLSRTRHGACLELSHPDPSSPTLWWLDGDRFEDTG